MFLGTYHHNLDGKGRVAVPRKFRADLSGDSDAKLVVTLSLSSEFSCLDIYPTDEWDRHIEKALKQVSAAGDPSGAAEREEVFVHNYVHPAQYQQLDSQGRILVAQEHRGPAKLDKEVVFTGDMKKFRLWSVEEWNRYSARTSQDKGKIAASIKA